MTDIGAPPPRHTLDVDLIVRVASTSEYATVIGPAMRALGAKEDDSEGAPLCRWMLHGVMVDVMPTRAKVLGFSNRWYDGGLDHAITRALPDGTEISILDAPHFIATKIEAFLGRGRNDFRSSKDIEDIIAVIDGRPELGTEIRTSPPDLRASVRATLGRWMSGEFAESIAGHLPGDMDNYGRAEVVEQRIAVLLRDD